MNDYIDISTSMDGSVLKKVVRKGDPLKGFPRIKDTAFISWKIYLWDGTLVSNGTAQSEPFSFVIGAQPRQVIIGWETCVKSMLEGELALVRLSPDVAFGSKGLPDKVPPNSTLDCELELLEVQPHFSRVYKPVGFNESIKEELLESLESRSTTASSDLFGSNSGKTIAENRSMEDIKFFDPAKMKIDPRLTVGGEAIDHVWSENMHSMDVEVSLPLAMGGASKKDLRVTLR